VASDHVDLITFHLIGQRRSGLLAHHAFAQLTRHRLPVILIEIKFLGHLVMREMEPHAIQAQYPHPKGLRLIGKERVRQIVQPSLAGRAQRALTLGLRVVASLLRNLTTLTPWITDTLWPAEGTDGFKTFGVVDEGLYVYHDASIAY